MSIESVLLLATTTPQFGSLQPISEQLLRRLQRRALAMLLLELLTLLFRCCCFVFIRNGVPNALKALPVSTHGSSVDGGVRGVKEGAQWPNFTASGGKDEPIGWQYKRGSLMSLLLSLLTLLLCIMV